MMVYLAGTNGLKNHPELMGQCDYFLESFLTVQKWQIPFFKSANGFLLDSGAFTFMNGGKRGDLHEYAIQYGRFVKEYDISRFFEIDVETIVGWDEYRRINDTLDTVTGRESIPVFHKNRGIEWFENACRERSYVAFGGVAVNSGRTKGVVYDVMPHFIETAHRHGAKIHGLGVTTTSKFRKLKFDSVDSTTWTMGGRMGIMCYFTGTQMKQFHSTERGKKMKDADALNCFNFLEWCKFQKYAEVNL